MTVPLNKAERDAADVHEREAERSCINAWTPQTNRSQLPPKLKRDKSMVLPGRNDSVRLRSSINVPADAAAARGVAKHWNRYLQVLIARGTPLRVLVLDINPGELHPLLL
ncbi:hypothetical protein ACN47E_006125 [Coniothyrium glycines]